MKSFFAVVIAIFGTLMTLSGCFIPGVFLLSLSWLMSLDVEKRT